METLGMREVNWDALNVKLCEALRVPTFTVPSTEIEGLEDAAYPNIIGVDVLLPLLAEMGLTRVALRKRETQCPQEWWAGFGTNPEHFTGADTPAHALALATAAALRVEVPYVD
jgi:hypothetical protein